MRKSGDTFRGETVGAANQRQEVARFRSQQPVEGQGEALPGAQSIEGLEGLALGGDGPEAGLGPQSSLRSGEVQGSSSVRWAAETTRAFHCALARLKTNMMAVMISPDPSGQTPS